MALTVEQKINMLILAGYVPCRFNDMGPRIMGPGGMLSSTLGTMHRANGWRFTQGIVRRYAATTWEWIPVLSIPDELIYEACDANH